MESGSAVGLNFIALDVETANSDLSSICQIGYCIIQEGRIVNSKSYLVDPKCEFTNSFIHGIGPLAVAGQPCFSDVIDLIRADLDGSLIIHHGHFDRKALAAASVEHQAPLPKGIYFDTAQFVRKVIPRYSAKGYALKNLCKDYGIEQAGHHQAENDARCLAQAFIAILDETGLTLPDLLAGPKYDGESSGITILEAPDRLVLKKRIRSREEITSQVPAMERNDESLLSGQTVLFTGDFTVPRYELEEKAVQAGLVVRKGITKNINYLVAGVPRDMPAYMSPSQKLAKAEAFNQQGANIQLITEDEFIKLLEGSAPPLTEVAYQTPPQEEESPAIVQSVEVVENPAAAQAIPTETLAQEPQLIKQPVQEPQLIKQPVQEPKKSKILHRFKGLPLVLKIIIVLAILFVLTTCTAFMLGVLEGLFGAT